MKTPSTPAEIRAECEKCIGWKPLHLHGEVEHVIPGRASFAERGYVPGIVNAVEFPSGCRQVLSTYSRS